MNKAEQIRQEQVIRQQIKDEAKKVGMTYTEYVKTHPNAIEVMQAKLGNNNDTAVAGGSV